MDREAIQAVHDMLDKALRDVPVSDGNRALRLAAEKAISMLRQQLSTPAIQTSAGERSAENNLPTELPTIAPIKWADGATFQVDNITDDFTRRQLQENPKLEQQIRDAKASNDPVEFFKLIWKPYVDAGLLYQTDLRGSQRRESSDGLDKRLFDVCRAALRDKLSKKLPTRSKKVDNEINTLCGEDIDTERTHAFYKKLERERIRAIHK
jgi:hypothetical protein